MVYPDFSFERKAFKRGYQWVIGVDEVGRGAFAGPLVVAAVVLPLNFKCVNTLLRINDSKLLSANNRVLLSAEIKKKAIAWDISEVGVGVINKIGIARATMKGMRKTVKDLAEKIGEGVALSCHSGEDRNLYRFRIRSGMTKTFVLVDYYSIPYLPNVGKNNQLGIKKGDQRSMSIAAASIIAKVHRDRLMDRLAKNGRYKKYGWERNKGYGTLEHRRAIIKYGLTKYHRKDFVRNTGKYLT